MLHVCSFTSVLSNTLQPHGLEPMRLCWPRNSPGKSTRLGCHVLFQGIFLTQGLNSGLLCLMHWLLDSLSPVPAGEATKMLKSVKMRILLLEIYILYQSKFLCLVTDRNHFHDQFPKTKLLSLWRHRLDCHRIKDNTPIVRIILQRRSDITKPASGKPLSACFMTLSKSWTIFLL